MLNFVKDNQDEDKKSTVAEDFKTGMAMGKEGDDEEKKVADTQHDKKSV